MVVGDEANNDAIRAEPVIRYLANADLTDPIWRNPRVVAAIFPGPYRVLFEAMVLAWQREQPRTSAIIARCTLELGTPISESAVEDLLRGAEYVDMTGVAAQVELLIQERERKDLLSIVSPAMRDLAVPGTDPERIRNDIAAQLAARAYSPTFPPVDEIALQLQQRFASENPGLIGLSSGLRSLDRITNGFPLGFLVVVAARVSVGKSAFAMQVGRFNVNQRRRVMYFSLELTRNMFMGRWIAQEADVDFLRWQTNELSSEERARIDAAVRRVQEVAPYLGLIAAGELREQTRNSIIQLVMREPPDRRPEIIIVDLISNLRPVSSEIGMPDWQRLDRESEALRNLGIQTNATVIAVCQLNRDITKRKSKRPMLSDIRGSGGIEQNADQVILLDNPSVLDAQKGNTLSAQQTLYLNVDKNRNGGPGTAEAVWVAPSLSIREVMAGDFSTGTTQSASDLWGET